MRININLSSLCSHSSQKINIAAAIVVFVLSAAYYLQTAASMFPQINCLEMTPQRLYFLKKSILMEGEPDEVKCKEDCNYV